MELDSAALEPYLARLIGEEVQIEQISILDGPPCGGTSRESRTVPPSLAAPISSSLTPSQISISYRLLAASGRGGRSCWNLVRLPTTAQPARASRPQDRSLPRSTKTHPHASPARCVQCPTPQSADPLHEKPPSALFVQPRRHPRRRPQCSTPPTSAAPPPG